MQHTETDRCATRRRRRRSCIINPAFQWKYAIVIALGTCLISTIMGTALYGMLHQQARLRAMNPETYHAEVGLVVLGAALAFSVLIAAAFGLLSFLLTHRICGPLFVMEGYLAELAKGRFPEIRPLRRKDEFKELHAAFARVVDAWKARRRADLAVLTQAVRTARSAASGGEGDAGKALESLVAQIEDLRAVVTESLGEAPDQGHPDPVPSRDHSLSGVGVAKTKP